MFTGIVQHVGSVQAVGSTAAGKRLRIDLGPLAEGLAAGDSVAVSGACLTVAAVSGSAAEFDAVAETLERTTLSELRVGSKVNLERAMHLGDELGGHLVQGHVDGTAEVRAIHRGGRHDVEFAAPGELVDQMLPKGSVAVDGVSLTLVEVGGGGFRVALIPATQTRTTLGELVVGSKVNVETDVIGRYVLRYLGRIVPGGGITMQQLRDAGFE